MGQALFYHLTRSPVEMTLSLLLHKAQQAGWRAIVRGTDQKRLDWLDEKLWLGPEQDFLPHGLAGQPHEEDQPVLLTTSLTDRPNNASCLFSVDGAQVSSDELSQMERVCILFDGNNPSAVETARGQWRNLVEDGGKAQYWSEESGRWVMKTQSG